MIAIDYLSVLSKHESDQRLHGLSGVGIVPDGLWVVLKLEWNPPHPRTPPIQISGAFTLLEPSFHLFFFSSDFATTSSSSSSTPATASSLASALYLIRTNYIAVLIRSLGCHL